MSDIHIILNSFVEWAKRKKEKKKVLNEKNEKQAEYTIRYICKKKKE